MTIDKTQDFFHDYANDFDAIYSNQNNWFNNLINRFFRKSMKERFLKTIKGCQPIIGKSVLDIGCGPGYYSITLAQKGADRVVGLDFAGGMIKIATEHARRAGVDALCEFQVGDFLTYAIDKPFDYVIVMGFMDYMAEPRVVIEKVLSATHHKAFFSFPANGGFLAWQRKVRYKSRCNLYLYTLDQLKQLFASFPRVHAQIEQIFRDFFVTVIID